MDGKVYPSLKEDKSAINAILHLSTLTNGALTVRAYQNMEKKTGLKLADLGEGSKDVRINYADLQAQPRRYNTSPLWSGLMNDGRAYAAYTYNVERLVPWRTLTGRQHFYLDHEMYIAYGEHLPTYKPSPKPEVYGDLKETLKDGKAKVLNCLTPHGKWHIHSTYGDTLRMKTLSRGIEPCWLSEKDANESGHQGQRLGRGLQRSWRVLHPGLRQRAHSAGRVHRLSRAGAHRGHPQVAGAGKQAGGRA